MSYDRQIDQVCPHFVVDETLYVGDDLRTVRPLRPIASANSVSLRINGAISVPSAGVYAPASTVGNRNGPFSIQTGVSDTLTLQVNSGEVQTAVLPATNRLQASRIVDMLNAQFKDLAFSVVGGKIGLQSGAMGPGATVFVHESSTLATLLGIPVKRLYRGRVITPGWTLVNDPLTLNDRPTRLIIFDDLLKGTNNFVEITYSTIRQECRRCGGLGIENDWRYNLKGEVSQVRDEALLIQELQKDFYTLMGTNPFHTWYGTNLLDVVGKKLAAGGLVQNMIISDITQAFARWQSIKRQQEGKVGQAVSDAEFPYHLLSVNLQQSTADPTVVFVKIVVQNRAMKQIELERGLRLPMPLDLMGSTAQQGAIRQSLSNFVLTG